MWINNPDNTECLLGHQRAKFRSMQGVDKQLEITCKQRSFLTVYHHTKLSY